MELDQILSNWNITDETVKQIYSTAWQVGDKYVLKTGSDLNSLKNNLTLIKALAEQNIPVAEIMKTKDGTDYVVIDKDYYFLSKKINGEHITDIYNPKFKETAFTFGEVLGRLHKAFLNCQERISCHENSFFEEITGWVRETFKDKKISLIPAEILEEIIISLEVIYPKLPRQLIHRDIHPGNLLFGNRILTGYIDFDLSRIDIRIFDLCYMALGLLIGNTSDSEKSGKWFEILHNMAAGYQTVIPLTDDEKKAVPVIMVSIELLFTAYFTNENKPELAENAADMLVWLSERKENIRI